MLLFLGIIILIVASFWMVFEKAGRPGWGSLIPIYNVYNLFKIAGKSGWLLLLMLIPIVNLILLFVVLIDLAKAFGKSSGFGIGLFFLPFIFYPILAFSDAQYLGVPTHGNTQLELIEMQKQMLTLQEGQMKAQSSDKVEPSVEQSIDTNLEDLLELDQEDV